MFRRVNWPIHGIGIVRLELCADDLDELPGWAAPILSRTRSLSADIGFW